jgi:hypothetical protein
MAILEFEQLDWLYYYGATMKIKKKNLDREFRVFNTIPPSGI